MIMNYRKRYTRIYKRVPAIQILINESGHHTPKSHLMINYYMIDYTYYLLKPLLNSPKL